MAKSAAKKEKLPPCDICGRELRPNELDLMACMGCTHAIVTWVNKRKIGIFRPIRDPNNQFLKLNER